MRIGMMTDVYKPHISGITNYISLNKRFLEKQGHEVYVFTFGDLDYNDEEEHIIRSPGLPLVDTGYYISFGYRPKARQLLYSMDVVHVHHPFLSGTLALRYCRRRGIPIVFTNHTRYDLYAKAYIPILPEVIGDSVLQSYLPSFCRACNLTIAPSQGMKEVMQRLGVESPIEVAPNGVDLKPFLELDHPLSREMFGFSSEDIVLIYVGRLGPEKNIPFLLRSFAGTAEAYERVRLVIVGDGPERDNLEDRVITMGMADKVHFTGMIPYQDLPRYFGMADAFVTASVTEVHPLSIIEAMASCLPVLGIISPGISDTIINGETGLLAPHDLAAFTAKMSRLVTEHDLRRSMAVKARQASSQYAIERTVNIMVDHYQRLVEQSSKGKKDLRFYLTRLMDRIQW